MKVFGLYGLALSRLKGCRSSSNGIIRFPDVFSRLCTSFSIKKEDCWELLFFFKEMGLIEIVCGHGVRIKG